MLYECAFCHKLVDEDEGIMVLMNITGAMIGNTLDYVFKCKNCMNEKGRELFEKHKKK